MPSKKSALEETLRGRCSRNLKKRLDDFLQAQRDRGLTESDVVREAVIEYLAQRDAQAAARFAQKVAGSEIGKQK